MDSNRLKSILDEIIVDFSATFCAGATIADLDPDAIEQFRERWRRKSGIASLDHVNREQLLTDAELVFDGQVTYAALLLFGTSEALAKYLAQAEVIFEYRNSEASLPSQQRVEFRQGFLTFQDSFWDLIDRRNDVVPYQDGFFVWDIPAFRERVVREAILNAVCHRDYRHIGSIFVRQFPSKLEIVSPGGLPPGITVENIRSRQLPRNRRLAEALTKCGLVERAGQGVDLMFEESIREGKLPPDFTGTDDFQVALTLWVDVRDPSFLRFLDRISNEVQESFATEDLVVLDLVHREQSVGDPLRPRLQHLRDLGIVETQGQGRGTHYFLSRRFYSFVGQPGTYTRRRGLDRETNKALLFRHIQDSQESGVRLSELLQVLPYLNERSVRSLLQEMKVQGLIQVVGRTNAARWFSRSTLDENV
jgi:ATP-dependent DNA helicase RecG